METDSQKVMEKWGWKGSLDVVQSNPCNPVQTRLQRRCKPGSHPQPCLLGCPINLPTTVARRSPWWSVEQRGIRCIARAFKTAPTSSKVAVILVLTAHTRSPQTQPIWTITMGLALKH